MRGTLFHHDLRGNPITLDTIKNIIAAYYDRYTVKSGAVQAHPAVVAELRLHLDTYEDLYGRSGGRHGYTMRRWESDYGLVRLEHNDHLPADVVVLLDVDGMVMAQITGFVLARVVIREEETRGGNPHG